MLLAAPLAVEAQQAAKIARIGYLGNSPPANPHLREVFLQGLRDLGYVEGPTGRRWVEILGAEIPKLEPDSGTKRVSTRERVSEVIEKTGAGGGS
jgi:hypothetical protein